jgi:pimeloyl-ACP methyl ester carboxylesterase
MATPTIHPFELIGAGGRTVRGDARTAGGGAGRPAVVLCGGFKASEDRGLFPRLADRLARAGFTAVTAAFPESDEEVAVLRDLEDLQSMMGALASGTLASGLEAPNAVGLLGHARGGVIAIAAAAKPGVCQALVTWAASANEWLDLEAAARAMRTPWLVLHGDADETVQVADAFRLYGWAEPGIATIQVITGGTHTFGAGHSWAGSTPQLDRATDLTVEWFLRFLM